MEIRCPSLSPKESSHSRLHSPFRSPSLAKKVECGATLFEDTNTFWRRDQSRWNCILYVACDFFHYTTCSASYFLWVIPFFTCTDIALTTQFSQTHSQASHLTGQPRSQGLFLSLEESLGTRLYAKTAFSLWKGIKCFPCTLLGRNLKTQQSAVIFDLYLKKNRSAKSPDYHDAFVFETNFRFHF